LVLAISTLAAGWSPPFGLGNHNAWGCDCAGLDCRSRRGEDRCCR